MKIMKNLIFAIMISAWPWSHALAEKTNFLQPFRLCTDADMKGIYKLINLTESPLSRETSWHQEYPNQYLEFLPGHTYNFLATKRSMRSGADLNKAIIDEEQGFHQAKKYTLDDKGELDLYLGDYVDYYYRCIISAEDTPTTHKGDMTLMGYSKYKSLLNKLFRPWP